VGQSVGRFGRSFCQLLDRLVGKMFVPLVGWLVGRSVSRVGWWVHELVGGSVSQAVGQSGSRQFDCFVGGLVVRSVYWSVGPSNGWLALEVVWMI